MASRPHPPNHIKNHINPHPSSTAYQGTSVPHPRTHIHPALQCCTHINPRNTHPRQPSTTVLCANQPPPLINRVSGRVSTACQGASAGQPPSPTHPRPPSTALPHQPRIWGRQYLGASVGQPPTPTHPHPPCCTNINPRAHQPRIWGSINTQYGTPSPPHLYPSLPRREHRDRGGLADVPSCAASPHPSSTVCPSCGGIVCGVCAGVGPRSFCTTTATVPCSPTHRTPRPGGARRCSQLHRQPPPLINCVSLMRWHCVWGVCGGWTSFVFSVN